MAAAPSKLTERKSEIEKLVIEHERTSARISWKGRNLAKFFKEIIVKTVYVESTLWIAWTKK